MPSLRCVLEVTWSYNPDLLPQGEIQLFDTSTFVSVIQQLVLL